MCESVKPLFEKLERAKFSGELRLTFESGKVASAELRHCLPFSELGRELPALEPEKEFALKP
jgi:hypothetical protein